MFEKKPEGMFPSYLFFVCGALVGVVSCDPVEDSDGILVQDSAQVSISTNRGIPDWPDLECRWRVVPALQLGTKEEEPWGTFFSVRGGAFLGDGALVVVDGGNDRLLKFDSSGHFLATAGREGDGPGEFRALGRVSYQPGGFISTFDWINRRLSEFDQSLEFVTSWRVEPPGGRNPVLQLVGRLDEGDLILRSPYTFSAGGESGIHRAPWLFLRMNLRTLTMDTLGTFMGPRVEVSAGPNSVAVASMPFSPNTYSVLWSDSLFVGESESPQILILDSSGGVRRIIRWDLSPRSVPDSLWATYLENPRARPDRSRPGSSDEQPPSRPSFLPFFGDLQVDDLGNIWVKEPGETWEVGKKKWLVLSPSGKVIGCVQMENRFRVLDIQNLRILGISLDSLDVQRIQVLALDRRDRNTDPPS